MLHNASERVFKEDFSEDYSDHIVTFQCIPLPNIKNHQYITFLCYHWPLRSKLVFLFS